MTTTETKTEWRETLPPKSHALLETLEKIAEASLKGDHPYYSARIHAHNFNQAEGYAGRLLGWVIAVTTEQGWEYQNTTCNPNGDMWLLFKNPYVFS